MLRVLVETVEFQLWIALLEMGNRHRHIGKYSQCIDLFVHLRSATSLKQLPSLWVELTGALMILDILFYNICTISMVCLVSQHEGILFSLSIKSIKATSMLERLDRSLLWLYCGGVHGVLIFIITSV